MVRAMDNANHAPALLDRLTAPAASVPSSAARLTRDEVMTAPEVADLLRMPISTVYYLARRGELPARRLGRTWRFLRPRLEDLLGGSYGGIDVK